jgi:chemotaxis protein histidine kinase CheA
MNNIHENLDVLTPQIERDVEKQKEQWIKEREEKRIRIEQYRKEQEAAANGGNDTTQPAKSTEATAEASDTPSQPYLQTLIFTNPSPSRAQTPQPQPEQKLKSRPSSSYLKRDPKSTNTVHPSPSPSPDDQTEDPMTATLLPPLDLLPNNQRPNGSVSELIPPTPQKTASSQSKLPHTYPEPILRTSQSIASPMSRFGLSKLEPSQSELPNTIPTSKSTSFATTQISEMLATDSLLSKAKLPPIENTKRFLTAKNSEGEDLGLSRAAEPIFSR